MTHPCILCILSWLIHMGCLWLHKIIGLFCKRDLQKRRYSAKETYNWIDPTDRSHPVCVTWLIQRCVMTKITCMRWLIHVYKVTRCLISMRVVFICMRSSGSLRCCSALPCVAVRCSVLQHVAVSYSYVWGHSHILNGIRSSATCCNTLQHTAFHRGHSNCRIHMYEVTHISFVSSPLQILIFCDSEVNETMGWLWLVGSLEI